MDHVFQIRDHPFDIFPLSCQPQTCLASSPLVTASLRTNLLTLSAATISTQAKKRQTTLVDRSRRQLLAMVYFVMAKSPAQMVVACLTSQAPWPAFSHPCMAALPFWCLATCSSFVLQKLTSLLPTRPVHCPNHIVLQVVPLHLLHEH